MGKNNAVVVGVDGSPSGRRAVELAAGEARLRGTDLHVVHALTWPPAPIGPGAPAYVPGEEALVPEESLRRAADAYLAEAVALARSVAPRTEVTTDIATGEALTTLVGLSHSAPLVVVGSRGRSSFADLLVGSVATQLAAHAHCPVLVARGAPDLPGGIVLGVDGSPESRPATAFAFAEASLRGVPLVAVHVWSEWSVPPSPPQDSSAPYARRPGMLREDEERVLAEALSGCGETWPDVNVERRSVHGRTREALIEAGEDAQLLVVGTRGRGGFSGMLLGSVSQAALHHAHCPVVVVPRKQP